MLGARLATLHALVRELLEHETLEQAELERLLGVAQAAA